MQKKNGISLIVLVITIIVMIILAGVIMISLNNSGIIKKAEQAVEDTNLQEIRNLAALKWSEAYLKGDGKYTQSDLYREVMLALDKENLDLTPYDIKVTLKGVSVNRIQYYTTLGDAVAVVNGDETVVSVKKENAVAGIYIENGTPTVVLLKDTTETARITLVKDMTIDLRGHKVTFDGDVGFDTTKNNTCNIYIDGTVDGSTISSIKTIDVACAIQVKSGNNVKIEGATLNAVSKSAKARTVITNLDTSVEIINCNINAITEAELGNTSLYAYGIDNKGTLIINNSNISADARGTNVATDPISAGVISAGTLYATNCDVYGTHSGLSTSIGAKTYINGGTYESASNGGMFFAHGEKCEVYVEGAKINRCEYKGQFEDFSNKTYVKSSLYIGNNTDDKNHMIINLNNCEITCLEGHAIFFDGTYNTVRISNSIVNEKIKIGSGTHKLYIGKGNKFDISNVEIPSGVDLEKVVEETDEVYTKDTNR